MNVDRDSDGFDSPVDCDDEDPAVNPDAEEACNALDDDCDGDVDEGEVYADRDGDGYGDSATTLATICVGEGTAAAGGDCDDVDPGVYPGAEEACDGADANCDGARSTCWLEDVAEWTFLEFDPDHGDGRVVSLRGDIDGDGASDVMVGGGWGGYDWTTDDPEGQVHIFRGGQLGFAGPYPLADADWTLVGGEGSQAAGGRYTENAATFVRDFDGDGLSEVLVGGAYAYGHQGTVWLVTGATLGDNAGELSLPAVADLEMFLDDTSEMYVGQSVGLAGDSDGDGIAEIAIASDGHVRLAPFSLASNRSDLGACTVIETDCDCHEFVLGTPADVDGDGVRDLVLGDFEYPGTFPATGRALVFLGGTLLPGTSVIPTDADLAVFGFSDTGFGARVTGLGDMDGDGDDDWAVAAPKTKDESDLSAGVVYLVPGGPLLAVETNITDLSPRRLVGPRGGNLGASVEAGDLDGDGGVDLALRSVNGPGTGRISVVRNYEIPTSGTLDLETAGLSFGAREEDDVSMSGPISMGDVNGDGRDDLLIGDYGWDQYMSDDWDGHAWLVLGF